MNIPTFLLVLPSVPSHRPQIHKIVPCRSRKWPPVLKRTGACEGCATFVVPIFHQFFTSHMQPMVLEYESLHLPPKITQM